MVGALVSSGATAAFAADRDELRVPYDVRMPVRGGMGYSWAFDGVVADLGFAGVFTGRELFPGVRPEVTIGVDGVIPGTLAVTLPDKTGKVQSFGFARGHLAIELGLGLRFGGGDGFMVAIAFLPSAVLGKVPGKIKDQDVGTVGAGMRWIAEVYPFFLDIREAHSGANVGRWFLSALGAWIGVRHDWADPERGGALTGGLVIDVSRAVMAPLIAR